MELFASKVFNDKVMKEYLSLKTYAAFKKIIKEGSAFDNTIVDEIAVAMKDWAIKNGALRYSHWFQPLTGKTAEKHESFITPTSDGNVINSFSKDELIKGEPDGSSFPSGFLRSTAKARAYTIWDPTSYAFIKNDILYIPSIFISYDGEALDYKTPLLRSLKVLNKECLRILKCLKHNDIKNIHPSIGPEQEYFLISKDLYLKRKDLQTCGRTLFGRCPALNQQLDDHYFANIQNKVQAFMNEFNDELLKLGIMAKTEHKEVAPGQYEFAPVFTSTNMAVDHNHLTMELLQKIALKHDLVCLLHEKPFAYVNGSGKHNNFSITTDTNINLFEAGDNPIENKEFLLFLCAVIKAVDEYQGLLRIAIASAGNDHRLGANEAPPAIISIFLGEDLSNILFALENGSPIKAKSLHNIDMHVDTLPSFKKDTTDRNRTSPFVFTGNKFEFRMLGSSNTISFANTILNTTIANSLSEYADSLEESEDLDKSIDEIIINTIKKHKKIIFNGDGYKREWIDEAIIQRGLSNYKNTPECIDHLLDNKNLELLKKHNVYTDLELKALQEVMYENYAKTIEIEANTMLEMVDNDYLAIISEYSMKLAHGLKNKDIMIKGLKNTYEIRILKALDDILDQIIDIEDNLKQKLNEVQNNNSLSQKAHILANEIIPYMQDLRQQVDKAEGLLPSDKWPIPGYHHLFSALK